MAAPSYEGTGGNPSSIIHHGCTSVWSPLVARAMVSRGYVRDVFRVLSSRQSDDTNRGTFQSRCYGRAHPGTECVVHLEVTWFSVCCAFDFRYATELVIVTHQLLSPHQPGTTRKASPSKSSRGALRLSATRRTSSRAAASVAPEPRGAAPSTSKITMSPTRERRLQARASSDCLIVFIERKQLAEKPTVPASLPRRRTKSFDMTAPYRHD